MVGTHRGTAYKPSAEHYGHYARQNSSLPGQKKHQRAKKPSTRVSTAKRQSEASLPPPPPPTPPDPTKHAETRLTRSGSPTCSHFGPLRRERYPGYFFCTNCDWFDENEALGGNKSKRSSKRFECRANHHSWLFPTEKMFDDSYARNHSEETETLEEDGYDADSDGDISMTKVVPPLLEKSETTDGNDASDFSTKNTCTDLEKLQKELEELKIKLHLAQKKAHRWKEKYYKEEGGEREASWHGNEAMEFVNMLQLQEESIKSMSARAIKAKKIGDTIWEACVDPSNEDGSLLMALRDSIVVHVSKWLRKTVFSPFNILKAMDMAGGQLSMEGLQVLSKMEANGRKWYRNGIIPSSAEIKRTGAIVEAYARQVVPYTHGHLEGGGEYVEWDVEKVLVAMLKGFGLYDIAKERPVDVHQSIDGAQISKHVTHVSYGLKMADKAAVCPFKKQPIFANPNETILQSRNLCFPVKIIMMPETKAIYSEFEHLFARFNGFTWSDEVPDLIPINAPMNCDMSAQWKALGIGGAAKRDKYPCHCCPIESDFLATPNAIPCDRWCKELHSDEPGWHCYHKDFLSEENLEKMAMELEGVAESIAGILEDIERIVDSSKLRCDEDPRAPTANSKLDIESIHFDFERGSQSQRNAFSAKVNHDLLLRSLDITGNLGTRQHRLRDSMVMEWTHRKLSKSLEHGKKTKENAMLLLINAVPCILHLENRTGGLKILTMLLMEGCANVHKGLIFTDNEASLSERLKAFLDSIEGFCNTEVFGSDDNPAQWQCPFDGNDKQIGTICLDNNRMRALVDELRALIDICIVDNDRKEKWKQFVGFHSKSLEILRSKDDLSNNEIAEFQRNADSAFQIWVSLHGIEGITNYFHMLGSGHIGDYLFHWRNLYKHSQQGWEAFNALLKVFYFRRTGRGGAGNRGTGLKSKVLLIAHWISRRIVFMLGISFEEMKQAIHDEEDLDTSTNDEEDEQLLIHE